MAWLVFNDAFLSVVEDRDDRSRLLVRARAPGHIEAVFPSASVIELDTSDYRYRAFLDRGEVARTVAARFEGIDYPNFKNSVRASDLKRFAMAVWQAGADVWGAFGNRRSPR